jgi:predicted Ser/Thr protein kinase
MSPFPRLSLEALHARAQKVFRRGGGSRPEVLLVDLDGRPAVLKDYAHSDPWFRRLIGPLSARREARALELLDGVAGVPRLFGRPARDAVLLEYVPGTTARELKRGELPPGFFDKFYRLVEDIHRRGVAHCDLRSTGNILVGPNGEPYAVDFVAHFKQGEWWNPLTRWIFRKFCEADRTAVARLKRSHAPELLTEQEQAALARDRKTPLERGARMVGKSIRNIGRWLLTRRSSKVRPDVVLGKGVTPDDKE